MLAVRARQNLVRARAARDADCGEIRGALVASHERGVRASEHVRRHIAGCSACRAYERDLRRLRRRLHSLAPPGALGPLAALLAKLLGGGVTKAAAGAAVAALVLAATGGVVVLKSHHYKTGDPSPFRLAGIKPLTGAVVRKGGKLPQDIAVVTVRVRLAAGVPATGQQRSVSLACPAGMRVMGLQAPEQKLPFGFGLTRSTVFGHSTRGTIVFGRERLAHPIDATVGILCKKRAPDGSMAARKRPLKPGETAGKVCVDENYIYQSPGKVFVGTIFRDEPVAIQRYSKSRKWVRIVPDLGQPGWVRASALC